MSTAITAVAIKSVRNEKRFIDEMGLGLQSGNAGGNPVAAFDVGVSDDAIGDLGSPLGSSEPGVDIAWTLAAVEYRDNVRQVIGNQVINGEGEPFRK